MTKEDIIKIEKDFAEVASKAKKAGFNGVEIHGAHYYLIILYLIKELMNMEEAMKIELDFY